MAKLRNHQIEIPPDPGATNGNPDPAVTTDFTLTIEVVNPNYKQGDPIGTRTYYLVSNTVVIARWE